MNTPLRKAAEMALKYFEDAYGVDVIEFEIKEALRQALAQPEQILTARTVITGREWVGLTGQELQDLCDQYHDDKIITVENLLLATEALLKGKNT